MSDSLKKSEMPSWVHLMRGDLSEYERQVLGDNPIVKTPEAAYKVLKDRAAREEVEVSYAIGLDAAGHVLGLWETGRGDTTSVNNVGREVYRPAVALGATMVVSAHNHTVGSDARPSAGDVMVHMALTHTGATVGIQLVDSLIITNKGYTSIQKYLEDRPEMRAFATLRFIIDVMGIQAPAFNGGGNPDAIASQLGPLVALASAGMHMKKGGVN